MTATSTMLTGLPTLPAGYRWYLKKKRAWIISLVVQRRAWYGWVTDYRTELNPYGLGIKEAIISAAADIAEMYEGVTA